MLEDNYINLGYHFCSITERLSFRLVARLTLRLDNGLALVVTVS